MLIVVGGSHRMRARLEPLLGDSGVARSLGAAADVARLQHLPSVAIVAACAGHEVEAVATVAELVATAPGCAVLVVADACNERLLAGTVKAGARGFLLTEMMPKHAADAIAELRAGGIFFHRGVGLVLLDLVRNDRAASDPEATPIDLGLSPREREMVDLLARGLRYHEIGRVLGISVNTVRTHIRSLYTKLGASSKAEAVYLALLPGA